MKKIKMFLLFIIITLFLSADNSQESQFQSSKTLLSNNTDRFELSTTTDFPLTMNFHFRISGEYYATLNEALYKAKEGDVIYCRNIEIDEKIINTNCKMNVSIIGGYDKYWQRVIGKTVLRGQIEPGKYTLTFNNFILGDPLNNELRNGPETEYTLSQTEENHIANTERIPAICSFSNIPRRQIGEKAYKSTYNFIVFYKFDFVRDNKLLTL